MRTVACKIGFLLIYLKKILSTDRVSQFWRIILGRYLVNLADTARLKLWIY
jgi:hypothetical protein